MTLLFFYERMLVKFELVGEPSSPTDITFTLSGILMCFAIIKPAFI
ncbi:hypothetical protein BG07_2088 [Bacillus pseudomycoides]|nr:hypothetical protein DJ92_2850 [Bacillus pseudomycoides]AJI17961.1 hypothetical protein BG07_2088 [Bacillus pseudomycoides]